MDQADMYSTRSISSNSRDTSKYVSQYGGTTETYNPASAGYGRKDLQPDSSKHESRFNTKASGDGLPMLENESA